MILVDTALAERQQENNPVNVALIGAGYMGRGIALQILNSFKGMRLAAVYNRDLNKASQAYAQAGQDQVKAVHTASRLQEAVYRQEYCITDDPMLVCQAEGIDAIIEATGEVEFGAQVTMEALHHGKHVILMNAELDATLGPILKVYADRSGAIITNADGDQPGVIMNLFRFVRGIGYHPVLAGNIKGILDHYRTPETQKAFAEAHKQKPRMITSFADGTKLSMEMAVVANATGFRAGRRGMYGPACRHVNDALQLFPEGQMLDGGLVDYVLGAEPDGGVFVIGYNNHPISRQYSECMKLGRGPFYMFYVPYHLPHLEAPLTAARAVLFRDAAVTPLDGPVCEVITMSKRELKAGQVLDGLGGFDCYGTLENADVAEQEELLPMGLAEGCMLLRNMDKNQAVSYRDVVLPPNRLADILRREQSSLFRNGSGEIQPAAAQTVHM